jgi:hypothetical protein
VNNATTAAATAATAANALRDLPARAADRVDLRDVLKDAELLATLLVGHRGDLGPDLGPDVGRLLLKTIKRAREIAGGKAGG